MEDRLLRRVTRAAGVSDLVSVLAERLTPTDLQSLMLAVYAARAGRVAPAELLASYERNRFAGPSPADPRVLAVFDAAAFALLGELGYAGIELSPLSPLGTVAAVTDVSQHKVLTTSRNSEVLADSTNVLALESAARRRDLLRRDPRSRDRVRLCASHRLVRGQFFDRPGTLPHFRLLALTTAGRDEGSFRFETAALTEQLDAHLRLLAEGRRQGLLIDRVRVSVTDLSQGVRRDALASVLDLLAARHPAVALGFDDEREQGRGYYRDACFFVHATTAGGDELLITDGGFTDWTAQLLSNAKERLLISGAGTERLCTRFAAPG
ncbi:hypothetical protein Cci01nite_55690 [Catellatospora citrea]|uniref:Uncharacterized protein n=1 Tax=Catellatospora citrea TaxID=53366 RepID=A0A8J3P3W1_9ACTN|nr:hypothetical protein C8E86_0956 [Catellatospora citrea]GIG00476.1 hypothetical protein Cci01nite_55690 [Catellatospora citrea]